MEQLLDEKAVRRYEAIATLLNESIEAGERRRLRTQIMENTGISERTLRRYLKNYREQGLAGLADAPRSDKGVLKTIPGSVIDEAVRLREELPARSVRQVIEILEGEKIIKPGTVARTTLNEKLVARGVGAKHMRQMTALKPARRFTRKNRNSLWQLDVKYGPMISAGNKREKTYLLAIIDDSSRMILHAEFYAGQRLPILEDAFRKALLKYGRPKDVLVDNGKIFVSKWFRRACAQLGIRHIAAKPYSPATKGKCEKFNQSVDSFLHEMSLEPACTLADLNRKFAVWLEEGYTYKPHSALQTETVDPATGEIVKRPISPYQAFTRDPAKIKYTSGAECREAFMWEETRRVDKTGCVKLRGCEYDVGAGHAGFKVDIRYDPFDLSVVDVWHGGKFVRKAAPLLLSEWVAAPCVKELKTPKATHSRLLKVYEERNNERDKARNSALSFHNANDLKGGEVNDAK